MPKRAEPALLSPFASAALASALLVVLLIALFDSAACHGWIRPSDLALRATAISGLIASLATGLLLLAALNMELAGPRAD